MIKKLIRSSLLFALAVLFLSCSFLEETRSGSVVFDFSDAAARAALIDQKAQIDIELTGDYTQKKTVSVKEGLIVTFDEVPVGAKIQAEATIFRVYNVSGRKDLYSGVSEPIVIEEGENQLPLTLKKLSSFVSDIADYTVQHYKQNIDDDDYTLADTDDMEGKYNLDSEAEAKTYAGFTALTFENRPVNPDGSTVIKIMYDRNVHTVTYAGGVSGTTISVPAEKEYRYGATVDIDFTTSVTRTGYDFAGWKNTATGAVYKSDGTTSFTMGDVDVTLTAQWQASSDTRYTVKHLKQNIDDDNYSEVTEDREEKTGVSLEQTNASPKAYTGFTAQPITQKTIAEDSSTIVEIKYDRNTYTVSYEDSVANVDISVPSDTNNYRYGATVTVDFTVGTSTGHTFKGWKDPESGTIYNSGDVTSFEIGAGDVTLYAQWEANTYTITYTMNGGSWASGYEAPSSYTYGVPLNLPDADDIVLAGYGLTGWYTTSTFDTGTKLTEIAAGTTEPVTVYAQWTAGATTYKVHHLLQKVDASGYEEVEDDFQTLGGVSETTTEAEAKSYPGFTPQTITQQTIAGNGSTEVTIKYDRNVYTVTYTDGVDKVNKYGTSISVSSVEIPTAQTYRHGETVNVLINSKPMLDGYSFSGWVTTSGTVYNTETADPSFEITSDVTLIASWTAANADYTIVHRLQNLVDTTIYNTEDTDTTQSGQTGTNTAAEANDYPGFTAPATITQEIIKPDGSTTIYIDYDRKKYTITYHDSVDGTITVPTDTNEHLYGATSVIMFTGVGSRTGYTFMGWTTTPSGTTAEYTSSVTNIMMNTGVSDPDTSVINLYAVWTEELQDTEINVGFDVDTSTVSVTISGTTATADVSTLPGDGTCTYAWTVDGDAQSSTTGTLSLESFTTVGVYDITLTVTKNSKTYTWTGQYIKS